MTTPYDEPIIKVHMVRDDTKTPPPPHKGKPEHYVIMNTYQAGTSPELILPHSPKRVRYWIYGLGIIGTNGCFVLATSEGNAQQANTNAVPLRSNALLPPSGSFHANSQNEVWLVSPYGTPPLVSVIAEYER